MTPEAFHVRTFGSARGPVGLWLHGWLGYGGDGEALADHLGMRLRCPDLPGHGRTPMRDWTMRKAVEAVTGLAGGCDWAGGYSMGARILMMAASAAPERFGPLVLESGFPGYSTAEDRGDRRELDASRAAELKKTGLEAFCRDWYANPMWGGMAAPSRMGNPRELADALERFGSGRQPDLTSWLRHTSHPILWLAGAGDTAYADRAEWIRARTRHRVAVLDAGHAVHRVCPREWARQVRHFLTACNPKEQ